MSYIERIAFEFGLKVLLQGVVNQGQTPVGNFLAETTRVWSYSRNGLQLSAL